jgi:hypothetical protein
MLVPWLLGWPGGVAPRPVRRAWIEGAVLTAVIVAGPVVVLFAGDSLTRLLATLATGLAVYALPDRVRVLRDHADSFWRRDRDE